MKTESQQPKDNKSAISTLNGFIGVINFAKQATGNTPANVIFDSVAIILTMVRVSHLLPFYCIDCEPEYPKDDFSNKTDYIDLGVACGEVSTALYRGLEGKGLDHDNLNDSVREAIKQLTS